MDHLLYWKLRRWGKRRHSNKGEYWLSNKYWQKLGGRNWVFATKSENNPYTLVEHGSIKSTSHAKVINDASPYDGDLVYWSTRMGKSPQMPKRTASLLKKQKGKCAHCELFFKDEDIIELDHIIPKSQGGKDEYKNWQLLHRHCHDTKTRTDGSLSKSGNQIDCNNIMPKQLSSIPSNYRWVEDMLVVTY